MRRMRTTSIPELTIPGWMGAWFSLFGSLRTFAGQLIAPPERPADREVRRAPANALA